MITIKGYESVRQNEIEKIECIITTLISQINNTLIVLHNQNMERKYKHKQVNLPK